MTMDELFESVNKGLKYYEIIPTNSAMGEEGKMIEQEGIVGYACVNKVTQVIEHTSTILPGVLFQAQHFDNTLVSLTAEDEVAEETGPMDDVVLQ